MASSELVIKKKKGNAWAIIAQMTLLSTNGVGGIVLVRVGLMESLIIFIVGYAFIALFTHLALVRAREILGLPKKVIAVDKMRLLSGIFLTGVGFVALIIAYFNISEDSIIIGSLAALFLILGLIGYYFIVSSLLNRKTLAQ